MTIERKNLIKQIEEILLTEIPLDSVARSIERVMNTEIPGTPRITGRAPGSRVMYVAMPGRGKNREALSARAQQVYSFLMRNRKGSSAALQSALGVNRNVISGAIHELKTKGLVKPEVFGGRAPAQSAAEYVPRRRKPAAKKTSRRGSRK